MKILSNKQYYELTSKKSEQMLFQFAKELNNNSISTLFQEVQKLKEDTKEMKQDIKDLMRNK